MERPEGRPRFRALDLVLVLALVLIAGLAAAFHSRVDRWPAVALGCLGAAGLFLGLNLIERRLARPGGRFFLRLLSVSIVLGAIYEASLRLAFIAWPAWQDRSLIALEKTLFGGAPTVWLQAFVRPGLTEWMMFAYVFYFALYPIVTAVLFFRHGEAVFEGFLFTLAFNNIACNLLYPVYPVNNPVAGLGALHTVPLEGYAATAVAELMRASMTPGGGMPSGHAAATTIMLLAAFKHERRLFYPLLPLGLSLIASTVYGRFHYLSDSLAGVGLAFVCWRAAPLVKRRLDRALAR